MHSQSTYYYTYNHYYNITHTSPALVLRKRISRTTSQICKVIRLIYATLSQLLAEWQLFATPLLFFHLFHTFCVLNLTQRYDVRLTKGGRVDYQKGLMNNCRAIIFTFYCFYYFNYCFQDAFIWLGVTNNFSHNSNVLVNIIQLETSTNYSSQFHSGEFRHRP